MPPQSYSYFQNSEYIKKLREIINYHNVPSDIIFIGGVHGVGKTYFRNKFLLSAGWYGVSASEIIKQKAGEVNINKRTAAIEDNQKLLQEGLSSIKQRFYRIALDGHFSLINKTGQVTLVSEDTFTGIEPSAIIVLTAPVEIIYDRLRARDDQKYTISFISSFQNQEIKYAKKVADRLRIPILILDSTEPISTVQKKLSSFLCLCVKNASANFVDSIS